MTGKTVLIVEDSLEERVIYATALEAKGYRVLQAAQAEDGLRLARAERPDVVVTDILLPSISGLTFSHILKSSRLTRTIPIVAMSCYHESAAETGQVGCRSFLPKPFEPMRLVEEVTKAIGEGGPDSPSPALLERVSRKLRSLASLLSDIARGDSPFPLAPRLRPH